MYISVTCWGDPVIRGLKNDDPSSSLTCPEDHRSNGNPTIVVLEF